MYEGITSPAYSLKTAQKPRLRLTFQIRLFKDAATLESQAKRGLVYPRELPKRSADTT